MYRSPDLRHHAHDTTFAVTAEVRPASLLESRYSMGYVCPNPGARTSTPGEFEERRDVLL